MADDDLHLIATSLAEAVEIVGMLNGILVLVRDLPDDMKANLRETHERLLDIHARLQERWP